MIRHAILFVAIALQSQAGSARDSISHNGTHAVSAPPRECEIRLRAWCIIQENSVISDTGRYAETDADHTWKIHHRDQPQSNLVILEPRGCRAALADTVEAVGYAHGLVWEGAAWDEMRLRLRKDGSCDLTLRVPVATGDPLEWPFSTGRVLLVACKDDACVPNQPTIADMTDKFRVQRAEDR